MISSFGASSDHVLQTWYRALTLKNVSNIFRSIVFLCFPLCHLPMLFSLPSLNPLNFFVIIIQKLSLLIVSVYICCSKAKNIFVLGLPQKLPWSTAFEIQSLSLDSTTGAPVLHQPLPIAHSSITSGSNSTIFKASSKENWALK